LDYTINALDMLDSIRTNLRGDKMNIDKVIFKHDGLRDISVKCLRAGYKVFIFQDIVGQVFIVNKDDQICTIHTSLGGLNIGTVHKPCRSCGTGYGLERDLSNVTINQVQHACIVTCPSWDHKSYNNIKKWKNFKEKVRSCGVLNYKEVIMTKKYRIKLTGVSESMKEYIQFLSSHHGYTLEMMYCKESLSGLKEYIEEY